MRIRALLYIGCSVIATLAVIGAIYFFIEANVHYGPAQMQYYKDTFYSVIVIVLCIETRVRMGYRLIRGSLFTLHLMAAIPFFILLGISAFSPISVLLMYTLNILAFCVILSGGLLFLRGLRKETGLMTWYTK